MAYAPGIAEFIDRCNRAMPPDFYKRPVEEQRRMYLGLTVEFPYALPGDVSITDETVAHDGRRFAIRVYRPARPRDSAALVYVRGGGFVVGSLETHNTVVAELAARSGLTAIALDFRMSPEHPFPAAIEDCYGALCGLVAEAARLGIDARRVVISGDSSGANQAVVVAMMCRDRRGPVLRGQALISPVLDFTRWRKGGVDAPLLTGGEMEYYTRCYAPEVRRVAHPYVSPLISGSFHGLPPAYVMGAEMDSLRVDSEEYARRVRAHGTPVELVVEPGLVHSAVRARGLCAQVADAWQRFCTRAAALAVAPVEPPVVTVCDPRGPAVIVDPYSSGAMFAPAFKDAGVPVVAVVSAPQPPAVYAASYRPADFPEILTFAGEHAPLVRRLRELRPRCVLAGCESGVELADALAPQVVPDVANPAPLASARRHKGDMAAVVTAAGLPVIAQICTDSAERVADWIEREGLGGRDLVIKPPKSASTDGVARVREGRGWREAFADQLGRANRLGIVNDRLLVQEYATGTEFVVDTFSHDGRHTVTDVCRYRKVDNGPFMAVYDAMEWMSPVEPGLDEVVAYAKSVLDALGVRFGAAHTEVMLTPAGPRLIEVGARPHGGGQPRFCRVATGDSQVDRAVRHFARLGQVPESFTLLRHVRVVFLISRHDGIVRNAEVFEEVKDLASHHFSVVHLANGTHLRVTRDLFGSLDLGFVVLAHESAAQVAADYEAVRAVERRLRVDPVAPQPPLEARPSAA